MSLGVVAQRGNDEAVELAGQIRASFPDGSVCVDAETGDVLDIPGEPVTALDECDLVVSIGGDGTFLFVARHIGSTPIMGINLGEVGFLTAISPSESLAVVQEGYKQARAGTLAVRERPRLVASGANGTLDPVLNELMVHAPQRGPKTGITATIAVNGEEYDQSAVDGVMIATPTGSTAYNLSERGPLVAPGVPGMVINQMCAQGGRPPLVVPLDATVTVHVTSSDFAYIVGDGRTQDEIDVPGTVTIERAADPLHIAGPPVRFFDALDKLS